MNDQAYDPNAAARRVDANDAGLEAVARSLDHGLARLRTAAALNAMAMAMEHAGHRDWTEGHVASLETIVAELDRHASVESEPGVVPAGFGAAVRTQQAKMMIEASQKAGMGPSRLPRAAKLPSKPGDDETRPDAAA